MRNRRGGTLGKDEIACQEDLSERETFQDVIVGVEDSGGEVIST